MQYQDSSGTPRLPLGEPRHALDPDQGDLLSLLPTSDPEPTTTERFEQFHAENPHVYDTLVHLARRFIAATEKRKLGVQRLVEIARWDYEIATKGEEEFEINNSFTPYYARLIMWQEIDLRGVFELRKSAEADAWIAGLTAPAGEAA